MREKLYSIWSDMKQRCYNPKNKRYKDYGGRGIIVDSELLNFENFYLFSVEIGYKE